MEEKHYYYKNGNVLLDSKHQLDETEIGNYVEISKEDYENLSNQARNRGNREQSQIDLKRKEIAELQGLLDSSDYKQHEFTDGEITEEEYAPIRAQRHAWRVRIRELRAEIENAQ